MRRRQGQGKRASTSDGDGLRGALGKNRRESQRVGAETLYSTRKPHSCVNHLRQRVRPKSARRRLESTGFHDYSDDGSDDEEETEEDRAFINEDVEEDLSFYRQAYLEL